MDRFLQALHEQVTNHVIQSLEQGQRPWIYAGDQEKERFLPYNLVTNEDYSGINTIILWLAAHDKSYDEHGWLTLKQATRAGWKIMKGENTTKCCYFKIDSFKDEETGERIQVPLQTIFSVFNLQQLVQRSSVFSSKQSEESAAKEKAGKIEKKEITPIDRCKLLIQAADANIQPIPNKQNVQNIQRAEYLYQKDIIYAPSETAFKVPENYYTSLLHGLMFWTGHENRLDRLSKLHGTDDEKAIFESLVADIGTGFLCAKFKLNGKWRLSNNLKDQWIQLLRTDPQVIFRAASLANKAYKHLLCLTNLKKNVVLAEEPVEPTESVDDNLCRDEDDTEEL